MTKNVGECGLMQDRQLPVACATQRLELCQDNFSAPPNIAYTICRPIAPLPVLPGRLLIVTVHKTMANLSPTLLILMDSTCLMPCPSCKA